MGQDTSIYMLLHSTNDIYKPKAAQEYRFNNEGEFNTLLSPFTDCCPSDGVVFVKIDSEIKKITKIDDVIFLSE